MRRLVWSVVFALIAGSTCTVVKRQPTPDSVQTIAAGATPTTLPCALSFANDRLRYNLCPLLHRHKGHKETSDGDKTVEVDPRPIKIRIVEETPPTRTTSVYSIGLRSALDWNGTLPAELQCPKGTWICLIVENIRPSHPSEPKRRLQVIPVAGAPKLAPRAQLGKRKIPGANDTETPEATESPSPGGDDDNAEDPIAELPQVPEEVVEHTRPNPILVFATVVGTISLVLRYGTKRSVFRIRKELLFPIGAIHTQGRGMWMDDRTAGDRSDIPDMLHHRVDTRARPKGLSAEQSVDLRWLDGKAPAALPTGTSFGIPWSQGDIDKTTPISIAASDGQKVPLQSWPLAYWPDGSLKWTGHALSAATPADSFSISQGTPAEPTSPVSVSQSNSSVTATTGQFSVTFNKSGTTLVDSISLGGKKLVQGGKIVVYVQNAPDEPEEAAAGPHIQITQGTIESVVIEQKGPVTGKYSGGSHAAFLPFTLRFYISAGATAIRMVHFFIYDGDQFKDFIKAIGLTFTTPLTDELYNRHVRFVTADGGIWGEPVRVLSGLRRDATPAVLTPQFNGQAVPDISTWPTTVSSEVDQLPVWSDYTLDQLRPNDFTVAKRSSAGRAASWLGNAGHGTRAAGVGYVGGAQGGGVVFGLKDFWQGAPRVLDIRGASGDTATVTLWAYSPRAPAMDMRHYDTVAHGLDLTYEDVGDPDPTPIGVGRSWEATIQLFSSTPSRSTLAGLGSVQTNPPQLVASPEFYASRKLFGGRWNIPDMSTSGARAIEKRKSDLLDFYLLDIEQRQFYGFWDFGDVMHTYDQTRHTWRYDVGGFAWDNGELSTDLWLWMSFLRTGRADVFRIAHAMTRHLSEVDTHHTGPFAGLGSRHNVNHWGDGAKEARVAGSTLRRPFYYLTADELMGDLMDFTLQADQTIMTWDPLRKVFPPPPPEGPGRLRIGPDWTTLAGNWFTKWERTNDAKWLERIKIGMRDIGGFKFGLFTGNGAAVGWNADTAHLVDEGGEGLGSYHLTMIFGGGELLMEAMDLIKDEPEFDAAWLDFCRLYNASNADKTARYGKSFSSGGFTQYYAKLQAYAGQRLNDVSIKQAAWNFINTNQVGVWAPVADIGGTDVINPIKEIPNLATNDAGQLSLSEYAVLAIAPELAPNTLSAVYTHSISDTSTVGEEPYHEKHTKGDVHRTTGIMRFWKKFKRSAPVYFLVSHGALRKNSLPFSSFPPVPMASTTSRSSTPRISSPPMANSPPMASSTPILLSRPAPPGYTSIPEGIDATPCSPEQYAQSQDPTVSSIVDVPPMDFLSMRPTSSVLSDFAYDGPYPHERANNRRSAYHRGESQLSPPRAERRPSAPSEPFLLSPLMNVATPAPSPHSALQPPPPHHRRESSSGSSFTITSGSTKINPTNYVSLSRSSTCKRNLVSLLRNSSSIKGHFAINPFMHVPGNLLASLPESENSSNQFSRKLNLRLDVQNGGIDVDIHLLGDAARAGEGGRKERAFLHLEVKDGYEQGLDKFPLVTRIHTPDLARPPFHLVANAVNGYVSLHLPNSFHGLLTVHVQAGDLEKHIEIASGLMAHAVLLRETPDSRSYFVGEMGGWVKDENNWEGDEIVASVEHGLVRAQFEDEKGQDLFRNLLWKYAGL
ncbi:hypothetical protein EYR38_002662 [Pleurotus pulmonarius]|nr:hypothetical protein EYR38_002662 [Pleurotus pulmonarius]